MITAAAATTEVNVAPPRSHIFFVYLKPFVFNAAVRRKPVDHGP